MGGWRKGPKRSPYAFNIGVPFHSLSGIPYPPEILSGGGASLHAGDSAWRSGRGAGESAARVVSALLNVKGLME